MMTPKTNKRQLGFSMVELMVVVLIFGIILSIAVPSVTTITKSYRITGDTQGIAAQLNLARMRAAALGTRTRVNFNLAANTYQIEVWNKIALAYQLQGGVRNLSQGDTFGFGAIVTPAGQQTPIAQGYPGEVGCSCIYFNSRGMSIDTNGNATANSAIYLTNNQGFAAVSVSLAGQPTEYKFTGAAWVHF